MTHYLSSPATAGEENILRLFVRIQIGYERVEIADRFEVAGSDSLDSLDCLGVWHQGCIGWQYGFIRFHF